MKFSLNLGQYYSNVDLKGLPHDDIIQRMGAQLGAIEDVVDWSTKYDGVVVAKVVSCDKHPDADKLSLCLVDDGGVVQNVDRNDEGFVQVVCGANNVAKDQMIAWIPPGVAVPSTMDEDPFVLEARELRGKISNGMIASPKELDISDEHEGILVITEEDAGQAPKPGEKFGLYYGLDDLVVDCENKMFTHRPDCFGNLGIARELAGIFGMKYESPDWYLAASQQNDSGFENGDLQLDVSNDIQELVPRFTVVSMNNIDMGPSPTWMQGYLKRVGVKPINNVVDVTNYVMHLTGQPLHAFDFDKLAKVSDSPGIFPRKAKKGEKITLLGDKEVVLDEADIVISTDKQAVAIAGVMGGGDTEVDENTRNIVIECANFDMYSIRRTSMRHGLFTDAVTRFNKGQSPLQNDRVLAYAMKLMSSSASATQASEVYDSVSFDVNANNLNTVKLSVDFINDRLGSLLKSEEIKQLLENVEFTVSVQGPTLDITAPFWRMDISIAEDIVEEVGRLYGYDKLPVVLPPRGSKPAHKNPIREFKQSLRDQLVKAGGNEVLTYSFVHGDLLKNTGTDPEKWAYHLRNALSPDLQFYRTSLVPSLLASVHGNIKAQAGSDNNEFVLFELGNAHVKGKSEDDDSGLPKQMRRLSLVVAADDKSAKNHGSPYYRAKKYVDLVTNGQAIYSPLDSNEYPISSAYQIGRSATVTVGDQILGVVGEFNSKARKSLKLPEHCAGFEIDTDLLMAHLEPVKYKALSDFPSSTQDITLEVKRTVSWAELYNLLHAELAVAGAENGYNFEINPRDIFSEEGSDKVRFSFRIELSSHKKTLVTEEVNKLLDQLSEAVGEKLHASRI